MSPDLMNALELPLNASVSMAFRRIPPGEFWMGSRGFAANEEPLHRVHVSSEFYLGATPVTQEQFRVWTASDAYQEWLDGAKSRGEAPDPHTNFFRETSCARLPADSVTWFEAVGYTEWLNKVSESNMEPFGLRACLPTEAQWEYACRAGTRSEYWNGDGEAALAEIGWYNGNSGGNTHPVGEKPANNWGLCDMSGNVWEWCQDAWSSTIYRKRSSSILDPLITEEEGELAGSESTVVLVSGWIEALDALIEDSLETEPKETPELRNLAKNATRIAKQPNREFWKKVERVLLEVFEYGLVENVGEVREIQATLRQDYIPENGERSLRVVRGGSWYYRAVLCRSAFRGGYRPGHRNGSQGFRVCLSPGPAPQTDTGPAMRP